MYGEMIEFEGGVFGMALNLERDSVGAVVLGDYQDLAEGQKASCTGGFSKSLWATVCVAVLSMRSGTQ